MKATARIKQYLEAQGKSVVLIRPAAFTKNWRLEFDPTFPCILMIESGEEWQEATSGVGVSCSFDLFALNTTAYEFQTAENDAIVEARRAEAVDCVRLLRLSPIVTKCEVMAMSEVYDGGAGDLLTGVRVTLKCSMQEQLNACGTPPVARTKVITENGVTPITGYDFADVQVQGGTPAVVEPLEVTPDTEAHTFNPPAGVDGYAPVVVGACPVCPAPMLQAKTAEPATTAQVVTADEGYDGLSSVTVDAVTAAIDANIQAGNIKKDVQILGVVGAMEPMPDGDRFVLCNAMDDSLIGDFFTNTELVTASEGCFYQQVVEAECRSVTTMLNRAFSSTATHIKKIIFPSCVSVANGSLLTTPCQIVEVIVLGTLQTFVYSFFYSTATNIRHFEVGQDTAIALDLRRWTATDVIAEGQSGIDELNYNIKTYLADRVADRTGLSALTVTFGASLYNVLTAETIAAFTAKNWNVASA